jgi:CheR methyltransferase, SAM binding domain
MASVAHNVMKLFRGTSTTDRSTSGVTAQKQTRRSSGMAELARSLGAQEGLCILDLGPTSPSNIRYFTERGHKSYSEDLLLASLDPALVIQDEQGNRVLDDKRFLSDNLVYPGAHFDVVFCWNLADYMDESLVKPVVGRLWSSMKPGGVLLAFFHTRDAGADAPCHRYHIINNETLEMHPIAGHPDAVRGASGGKANFRLQRVFNNRHIENLFRDFSSIKFFLARDNVREVLVIR